MTTAERERFDQMREDIAIIKQAIVGNGTPGLHDRVTNVEKWINRHPRVCPVAERKAQYWVRFGGTVALAMALLKGAELGGKALHLW